MFSIAVVGLFLLGVVIVLALGAVAYVFLGRGKPASADPRYLVDRNVPLRRWAHGALAAYRGNVGDPAYWTRDEALQEMTQSWSTADVRELTELLEGYRQGEMNVAFDKARIIWLARVAQGCGWFDEAKSWGYVQEAARAIKAQYPNWEAVARDIEAGAVQWSREFRGQELGPQEIETRRSRASEAREHVWPTAVYELPV